MASSLGRNSTNTATPTKATFAYWLKGADDGTAQGIWGWHRGNDASNYWLGVYFSTNGSMYFNWKQGGNYATIRGTTQKFRDNQAWGQHVITIDTTLATAEDRVKWFYNGERITSFEDSSYTVAENATITNWSNSSDKLEIGTFYQSSTAKDLSTNSSITGFHFCDGYAYEASSFGSFNSTTGIWVGNPSPSVSYGSQGEYIKFEDSSNLGLDSSGNTNNMAVSGSLTQNLDNPSNNFCTLNGQTKFRVNTVSTYDLMKYGNNELAPTSNSQIVYTQGTIGVTSGKWYWEAQPYSGVGFGVGICYANMQTNTNAQFWDNSTLMGAAVTLTGAGNLGFNGKSGETYNTSFSFTQATQTLCFALDMDNNALYVGIDGVWQNSGNPTSGASRTGSFLAYLASDQAYTNSGQPVFPFVGDVETGNIAKTRINFGQGVFGLTPLTGTTYTDGNSEGKFKYTVPTGYYTLNTKNLKEFG